MQLSPTSVIETDVFLYRLHFTLFFLQNYSLYNIKN